MLACAAATLVLPVVPSPAMTTTEEDTFRRRLLADLLDKRFMVTGDLTKELYTESATFQDEIDTYKLDAFVDGTGKLFDPDLSEFRLVGDVAFKDNRVLYRFDELLSFRLPLKPRAHISGSVELTRSPDGRIERYRERWDQSVPSTLGQLALDGLGIQKAQFGS